MAIPKLPAKVPVSILIPIRNEAGNLPRCLAAVAWADEIIVVDSQSTDDSAAIAAAAGARVVQFAFNGTWPKKKNWALENVTFRHDWVFILDADEVLSPEAGAEMARVIAGDGDGCAGYWINRRFMFMGGWLQHAYYPNWNLRLIRHRFGRYEQLVQGATQSGDNEVHEHIIVAGRTGRLRCEMDHYAFPSIEVFVEKHNRYSNWEARLEVEDGLASPNGQLQSAPVGWRRRLKRWTRRWPGRPTLRFLYVYVLQGGWRDGWRGYYFARLHAFYEFLSVAKATELRWQRRRQEPGAQPEPEAMPARPTGAGGPDSAVRLRSDGPANDRLWSAP
jgi:glycosyltransferase involved in cell wall biosynthesis